MSKYELLIILNLPFILYGYLKALIYFRDSLYNRTQLVVRLMFWTAALSIILLARPISDLLVSHHLTSGMPLNLADVLLASLSSLLLAIIIRLYSRLEKAERKLSDLIETLAFNEAEDERYVAR